VGDLADFEVALRYERLELLYLQRAGLVPAPPPSAIGPYLARVIAAAGDRIKTMGDILRFRAAVVQVMPSRPAMSSVCAPPIDRPAMRGKRRGTRDDDALAKQQVRRSAGNVIRLTKNSWFDVKKQQPMDDSRCEARVRPNRASCKFPHTSDCSGG